MDRHPGAVRRASRRVALVVSTVLVGVAGVVGGSPASADPPPPATVVAEATETTPAGTLSTVTVAVAPGEPERLRGPEGVEVEAEPGTQMVGVSWTGPLVVDVEVRARVDGDWTDWFDLHADDSSGSGRPGAGPAWLGGDGADAVAVRIPSDPVTDVRLDLMRFDGAGARSGPRATTIDTPVTPAGGPPVHTRAAWAPGGWNSAPAVCPAAPVVMDDLRFAVVHHTAGSNSYSAADVPGILAGIYRFHTASRGWCDIAYNFLVDRFGRVWEGRMGGIHAAPWGGHTLGFNELSTGIALLGQHHPGASPAVAQPSAAALDAVRDVLAWKLGSHGLDPAGDVTLTSGGSTRYPEGQVVTLPVIQGHRHTGTTSCPGDLVFNRFAWLRQQVVARIAATADPGPWSPSTTGAAFFGRLDDAAAGGEAPNGTAGFFTSLVERAGWPRNDLAAAIVLSDTTESRIGLVDRLYRAAFVREAETRGLRYWVDRRDAGMSARSMARTFTVTPEFRDHYDHLDDAAYVDAIYRNVLDRPAEPAGLAYWVTRLEEGASRWEVLTLFSESAEHRATRELPGVITRTYLVMLDRAATAAERATWIDTLGGGAQPSAVVAWLAASDEFAAGA